MRDHVSQWLNAYHDGELRGRRLVQVKNHLAGCPECQAELEQIETLSALLQSAPAVQTYTTPDEFVDQIGLQLPRQAQQAAPHLRRSSLLLNSVPVAVLVAIGFLQAVSLVTALLTWIERLGINPQAVSWLVPRQPNAPGMLRQVFSLAFGWVLPFNASITVNLILPALLAGCYLLWLVLWWMRQENTEDIKKLNGAHS